MSFQTTENFMHHFFHHFGGARHAGRQRGMFGFGFEFGPGFPGEHGRGPGRGGMGPGRKLGSADLQLLILALLAEKPRHGYEIIKSLDERSNGYYSPSPGMVYPALTYLEEIGHATVAAEGAKKLYSITEEGVSHLEKNRAAVDSLLEQLAYIGQKMEYMRRAMSGKTEDEGDIDGPQGHAAWHKQLPEVRQARRNLKSALIEKFGASSTEQLRIAQILERAAAEIRGA
jgi:DNA-binding PadR family transcriptional regulator